LRRARAVAALLAFLALLVWVPAAASRQAANVTEHLRFAREHVLDPVGRIRREQYGAVFQAAVERIAAEIPADAEYRLVESRDPGCDPYWVRSALVPRAPRSLGPEAGLRRENLETLLARSPRVFVVGCNDGAPVLLSAGAPPESVRP
jgi:hypothetical protein